MSWLVGKEELVCDFHEGCKFQTKKMVQLVKKKKEKKNEIYI